MESERVLGWYSLVQDVYDAAPTIPTQGSERSQAWSVCVARAASYFGLEQPAHYHGVPASPP